MPTYSSLNEGARNMLARLLILASFVGGFARAPWWFWVVGGVTLALLFWTDPQRQRTSYADVRGVATLPLLLEDLKSISLACLTSAVAFALGSVLSWPLIH